MWQLGHSDDSEIRSKDSENDKPTERAARRSQSRAKQEEAPAPARPTREVRTRPNPDNAANTMTENSSVLPIADPGRYWSLRDVIDPGHHSGLTRSLAPADSIKPGGESRWLQRRKVPNPIHPGKGCDNDNAKGCDH